MSRVDASTSLSQSYSSYSGVDIRVIINGHECGNIQHLSYMIQREKAPNYVMGSVDPISFGRGKRGINGVIRGLLLDVDLLYSKSFEQERALLDKDELFLKEVKTREEQITKRIIQPRLKRYKAPETRSKFEYIYEVFLRPNIFPGQSVGDIIENCIQDAIQEVLVAVLTATVSAGTLTIPAAGRAAYLALTSCAEGIIEGLVYSGGVDAFLFDLTYLSLNGVYEDHLKDIEDWNRRVDEENSKLSPKEISETKVVESSEMIEFGYTENQEYNLENLGDNYTVSKAEYLDQILPFDIAIIAVNEYGQSAQMRLYGCEILSANSEFSIDSMTVPYSLNFTARAILPWRSFDLGSQGQGATDGSSIKPRPVPTKPSPAGTSIGGGEQNGNDGLSDEELEEMDEILHQDPQGDVDADGVPNEEDIFPFNPEEQSDNDNDGIGDEEDSDDDNDGVEDQEDSNPIVPDDYNIRGHQGIEEPLDSDGDGVPDTDDFDPNDPNVQFPSVEEVRNVFVDTDNDGNPNMTDPDNDNDGLDDKNDPNPNVPDPLSYFDEPLEFEDDPGVNDEEQDGGEDQGGAEAPNGDDLTGGDDQGPYGGPDTDGDTIPDDQDDDIDGDGVPNEFDALPEDPNEHIDNDKDGVGANSDNDDNDPTAF